MVGRVIVIVWLLLSQKVHLRLDLSGTCLNWVHWLKVQTTLKLANQGALGTESTAFSGRLVQFLRRKYNIRLTVLDRGSCSQLLQSVFCYSPIGRAVVSRNTSPP